MNSESKTAVVAPHLICVHPILPFKWRCKDNETLLVVFGLLIKYETLHEGSYIIWFECFGMQKNVKKIFKVFTSMFVTFHLKVRPLIVYPDCHLN